MVSCKDLRLKPEDGELYWWCTKHEKYVDRKDCTIIPCQLRTIGDCPDAEFPECFKKYLPLAELVR